MATLSRKLVRLPVRQVDGALELSLGGSVPLVEGTEAELVVPASAISDPLIANRYTEKKTAKVLPQGTMLIAMLSPDSSQQLNDLGGAALSYQEMSGKLGHWFGHEWHGTNIHFIPLHLGSQTVGRASPEGSDDGGLWMEMLGPRCVGLHSSSVILPKFKNEDKPATSLNHALTVLSERYETQRISHTGNVYEQVLYQERNGLWYPLKLLRDGKTEEIEDGIAADMWRRLLSETRSKSGR
jgi:hypothetical protein